jgi:GT2 family glycosyltransferase
LDSLLAYGDWLRKNCEVFVVDNDSSDGSAKSIQQQYPWVKLIASRDNLGYSKGNNLALRQATGTYQLLLNPDTIVPPNTLQKCIAFLQTYKDCAVVTCKVEFPNGKLDVDCHRGFPTPWASFTYFSGLEKLLPHKKRFGQYHQTYKDFRVTHEIDSAVGAFMMMPKKVIDQVGLLDEDFFFYGEDLDWCYRFKENGFKVYYFPEVRIIHYKGVSSGIRKESKQITSATEESKKRVSLASVTAMRLFYDKHYKQKYLFLITWFVYTGIWLLKQKRVLFKK